MYNKENEFFDNDQQTQSKVVIKNLYQLRQQSANKNRVIFSPAETDIHSLNFDQIEPSHNNYQTHQQQQPQQYFLSSQNLSKFQNLTDNNGFKLLPFTNNANQYEHVPLGNSNIDYLGQNMASISQPQHLQDQITNITQLIKLMQKQADVFEQSLNKNRDELKEQDKRVDKIERDVLQIRENSKISILEERLNLIQDQINDQYKIQFMDDIKKSLERQMKEQGEFMKKEIDDLRNRLNMIDANNLEKDKQRYNLIQQRLNTWVDTVEIKINEIEKRSINQLQKTSYRQQRDNSQMLMDITRDADRSSISKSNGKHQPGRSQNSAKKETSKARDNNSSQIRQCHNTSNENHRKSQSKKKYIPLRSRDSSEAKSQNGVIVRSQSVKSTLILSGGAGAGSQRILGSTLDAQDLDFKSLSTERANNRSRRYDRERHIKFTQQKDVFDQESFDSRRIQQEFNRMRKKSREDAQKIYSTEDPREHSREKPQGSNFTYQNYHNNSVNQPIRQNYSTGKPSKYSKRPKNTGSQELSENSAADKYGFTLNQQQKFKNYYQDEFDPSQHSQSKLSLDGGSSYKNYTQHRIPSTNQSHQLRDQSSQKKSQVKIFKYTAANSLNNAPSSKQKKEQMIKEAMVRRPKANASMIAGTKKATKNRFDK
ncbi:UNKNOWN [Stylonychia lemnae]|uniref:Uncharacterized protein n=1 Tax=Stylonychia lemnae TaxID=5949 RepID=A0A078AQH5_STYLE|nr:UNKNOWN [Stylonychia lemnae]|eukprot:CDW84685.1 UNKNOWN [Stylonychia lemnae]